VSAYTFKSGLLSKLAHDLLIDVTDFTVNIDVPEDGFYFRKSIQEKEGGYHISGELSLHGVTKPVDFDIDTSGGGLKGRFTIIQTDYK
jgi:polyisoprenoid-binding protein YceI